MTPPVGKFAPPNSARPTDDRTAATDDLRFVATYGPSRAPLGRSVRATERQHGYRPFHGIISCGLRQERIVTVDRWLHAATLLDAARSDPRPPADPSVEAIVTAADHHGVLTFDESLATARAIARRLAGDRDAWIELWNPKEGHTSSVWRIRVTASDGSIALDVAANVAHESRSLCRTPFDRPSPRHGSDDGSGGSAARGARQRWHRDARPTVVGRIARDQPGAGPERFDIGRRRVVRHRPRADPDHSCAGPSVQPGRTPCDWFRRNARGASRSVARVHALRR